MWWPLPLNGIHAVKLKQWREQNGKTQQWVADELTRLAEADGHNGERVTDSSVQRWEAGTVPRRQNIRRVMKLTGDAVGFADFYGETGEKPQRQRRATAISQAASRKASAVRRAQAARP